jgi:hypothetical protein
MQINLYTAFNPHFIDQLRNQMANCGITLMEAPPSSNYLLYLRTDTPKKYQFVYQNQPINLIVSNEDNPNLIAGTNCLIPQPENNPWFLLQEKINEIYKQQVESELDDVDFTKENPELLMHIECGTSCEASNFFSISPSIQAEHRRDESRGGSVLSTDQMFLTLKPHLGRRSTLSEPNYMETMDTLPTSASAPCMQSSTLATTESKPRGKRKLDERDLIMNSKVKLPHY